MTEELKIYLEQSKASRKKLQNLAKNYKKCLNKNPGDNEVNVKDSDFPDVNALRFKAFKEEVNKNLQKLYIPHETTSQEPKNRRSISYRNNKINLVYDFEKSTKKKIYMLPPLRKNRELSIPDRLFSDRPVEKKENNAFIPTAPTPKKITDSRFNVKKMLLVPVLQKKSSGNF